MDRGGGYKTSRTVRRASGYRGGYELGAYGSESLRPNYGGGGGKAVSWSPSTSKICDIDGPRFGGERGERGSSHNCLNFLSVRGGGGGGKGMLGEYGILVAKDASEA